MDTPLIEGVTLTPLARIAQPRGDILHAMKRSSPGFKAFGEAYFSMVNPGDVKGWKRHRRVTLNLVVAVGSIRFVIREGEDTARLYSVTLGPDVKHARLTVAPGLWVAFQGREQSQNMLLNIADEEHDPAEADNEDLSRFAFDWKS